MIRSALQDASAQLTSICEHYERSAPTVRDWADDLYIRLGERADDVRVSELLLIDDLVSPDFMQPNLAANRVYKLQERLGQSTVGQAGF